MAEDPIAQSHTPIASLTHSVEPTNVFHIHTRLRCNLSTLAINRVGDKAGIKPKLTRHSLSPPPAGLGFSIRRQFELDFRFQWDAESDAGPIARDALSAADLYWLDPTTDNPTYITSTFGQVHSTWPNIAATSLGINITAKQLQEATRLSDGAYDWMTPQLYLARLSFYPVRLPSAAPILPKFDNLVAVRNLSLYNLDCAPQRIRLVFHRRGKDELSLWASSDVLSENCPYFETLMASDFAESQFMSDDKRNEVTKQAKDGDKIEEEEIEMNDSDSDIDVDEILDEEWTLTIDPPRDSYYHRIVIRNAAYTTYRAVLMYIQTGYISFSPLTSSFSHLPPSDRARARLDHIREQSNLDSRLPLPASPKSVYKLAHYLSLPALQSLALAEISRQLSIENVFIELFDGLASVYDEVRRVMVAFAVEHKKEVVETEGFKGVMEKLRRNELELSGPVVADLLPLLVG
ncbi:hypothetical protein JCM5353_002460 [Sporobolomyces roseus]